MMRKLGMCGLVLVVLAACQTTSSPPANVTTGYAHYERKARNLYVNGDRYVLPETLNTTGLRSGDRIRVTWTQAGTDRVAQKWSIDKERRPTD